MYYKVLPNSFNGDFKNMLTLAYLTRNICWKISEYVIWWHYLDRMR